MIMKASELKTKNVVELNQELVELLRAQFSLPVDIHSCPGRVTIEGILRFEQNGGIYQAAAQDIQSGGTLDGQDETSA